MKKKTKASSALPQKGKKFHAKQLALKGIPQPKLGRPSNGSFQFRIWAKGDDVVKFELMQAMRKVSQGEMFHECVEAAGRIGQ